MLTCLWLATDKRRVLPGVHQRVEGSDCEAADCPGCSPCTERHCTAPGCPGRHLGLSEAVTCATCVGTVRKDLADIATMCDVKLDVEAQQRGVDSEAMMLNGPAADVEAWGHRALSAVAGRINPAYLEDCRDELHPLWVTGSWVFVWSDFLGHNSSENLSITKAVNYLSKQLTYMAQLMEPDFGQFANEMRRCRGHLEDVLREGERDERGAPCPMCGGKALIKRYADKGEPVADDRWVCPRADCGASYTESDYRAKVEAAYLHHASALTASQIRAVYRVPEGTTRRWASGEAPRVHTRGRDAQGRQLYDVADVLAARDERERDGAA